MNFSLETALQFRRNVPKTVGVKIVVDGAMEVELEKLVAAGVERLALGQAIR
jgi:deoxyribose-phosphate aldolase